MDIIPDGVIKASDHAIIVEAGEALSENDSVYVDSADSLAYKCDADDLAKIGFIGFVVADATSGNPCYIKPEGHKGGFTGLTPGDIYYVSGTAGEITNTKPSNYKIVCRAVSDSIVKIITEPTIRVRVYTADATYTKPANLIRATIEVQAGGGNGATANGSGIGGGGGGAGAYAKKLLYGSEIDTTEAIIVGGVSGTSSFTNNGTIIQATGGVSISGNDSEGSNGGVASGGDLNIDGQDGDGGGNGGDTVRGGKGGSSFLGEGGGAIQNSGDSSSSSSRTGKSGKGYGSGGSGSTSGNNSNGTSQGAGRPGVVIITEEY